MKDKYSVGYIMLTLLYKILFIINAIKHSVSCI